MPLPMWQRLSSDPDDGVGANTKHPDTKRSYVLRSFIFCELCGHRMHGKTRRQTAYYACQPSGNLGRGAERKYGDHPVSLWVREESLLEGVLGFFSERVFGPNRRDLLEADLRRSESSEDKEAFRRLKSLEKAIGQFESRQARLIRSLELDDDPQGAMFRQIRDRMQQLENERREKLEELEALRREQPDAVPGSPGLLDELPVTEEQLVPAPEIVLRDLFEAFRLEVRYNKVSSWATCRVAINEEGIEGLVAHSAELLQSAARPLQPSGGKCSLLVGAPNRSLFELARPEVSRGELVIAGGFSRLFLRRDTGSVASLDVRIWMMRRFVSFARTGRKGRQLSKALVHVEATYDLVAPA
jgi:hypothetical protein